MNQSYSNNKPEQQAAAAQHVADDAATPSAPMTLGLRVEYDQSWLMSLLRPTLVIVMVSCIGLVMSAFVMRFFAASLPASYFWLLAFLTFFTAALAVVTTTLLAQPSRRLQRTAVFRLSELALLLALTRIIAWAGGIGFPPMGLMLVRPVDALFDPIFIFSAVAVGVAWMTATDFTGDMNRLALQPDELYSAQQRDSRSVEIMRAAAIDRRAVMRQIVARWVILGLLAIILAALMRREMNLGLELGGFLALLRQGVEPVIMVALIVYFLTGLLLVSEGQLALLRARWTINKTPSAPAVAGRWPFYVLLLVIVIGAAAAILPLGGTLLLSQGIIAIVNFILFLIWWLYRLTLLLVFWLLSLFAGEEQPPPPLPEPEPAVAPMAPPPTVAPIVPDWLNGVALWGALAVLVAFAAVMYFRDRGVQFTWLHWLIAMLRLRWEELTRFVGSRGLTSALGRGKKQPLGKRGRLFSWRRSHWDTPEAQVRYYYLSALHDAEEAGVPRQRAETPFIYEPRLEGEMSAELEEGDAIKDLTEAFVEVRYAGLAPAPDRLAKVREKWQALHRALQKHSANSDDVSGKIDKPTSQ